MAIAIKNLINNAMKYSENQSFVKLRLWEKDNLAIFEIEDHGCGMDEETQKHIYDRFYRADKSGLWIGTFSGTENHRIA